jgi:threonine synthase
VIETHAFACEACGARVPADALLASGLRCPNYGSGDGRDHVLAPLPQASPLAEAADAGTTGQPFIRYRNRLTSYHVAREHRLRDDEFVELVESLDRAVAAVDGAGFAATPLHRSEALDHALGLAEPGGVWIKDETGNVSGSHKSRHVFGIMLYLKVLETLGIGGGSGEPLAIASCGNAALAAAVVARAGGRRLTVFVPPSAHPAVMQRLRSLDAVPVVCDRRTGETGDPCHRRFLEAVSAGALAFCCQGPDNALTIEGGETLVWEMHDQMAGVPLDRMFVQVGGGALASACARAWATLGRETGVRVPRLHAVQTAGGFPLARAWARVALRTLDTLLVGSLGFDAQVPGHIRAVGDHRVVEALRVLAEARGGDGASAERAAAIDHVALAACADGLRTEAGAAAAMLVMRDAAANRAAFMRPWESEPRSAAHGILDDETYDWRSVTWGMIASGGWPVVVSEDHIAAANRLGRATTRIDVDHTGTAGLAGLMALAHTAGLSDRRDAGSAGRPRSRGEGHAPLVDPAERVAVIFSGVRRS